MQSPEFGQLSGIAPNLSYVPPAGFVGKDQFTFKAAQADASSLPATVIVVVAPSQDLQSVRPDPAYLQTAQPLSPTDLSVNWLTVSDDFTPPSQIRYDVYVSREADFFPSASSLVATVYGATETVVTNLEPGLRYYVKVMATDGDGNSSLETKPLSIKMSYQSFVTRGDVNIYLAKVKPLPVRTTTL